MALLRSWAKVMERFGKTLTTCEIGCNQSVILCTIRNHGGYATIATKLNSRPPPNREKCDNSMDSCVSGSDPHKHRLLHLHRNVKDKGGVDDHGNSKILEEELMSLMKYEKKSGSGGDGDGSRLVGYCDNILASVKPSDRGNITERMWNVITNDIDDIEAPTLEEYNGLLKVWADYSQSVDPEKFLKGMKTTANAETHKLLLKCAAKSGNIHAALYVLSLMKVTGCSLNEEIFNYLIELYARRGDVRSARLNLERMIDSGIKPSSQIWTNVARAHAAIGDTIGMEKVLKAETEAISDEQIMDIVETLVLSNNNSKHIERAMEYFSSDADFNNTAIADAINELAYAPNGENVYLIVDRMTSDVTSYKRDIFLENYLKTVVRAKTPVDAVLRIIDNITEKKKYSFAIMDVCGAALENGESKLAMRLFERMHNRGIALRAHYYWPLLIEAWQSDGETGIFRTIKHMLHLDVCLDDDTFFHYIFPRINISDVSCTLLKFGDIGVEASTFVTPLIRFLLRKENFDSTLFLCAKYRSMIDFSKILHSLGVAYKRNLNIEKTVQILSYAPRADNYYPDKFLMNVFGEVPQSKDVGTINKFIESFEKFDIPVTRFCQSQEDDNNNEKRLVDPLDSLKMFDKIPHPRDMSVDQLECHLIELRSKGMNKRGVLRKLLLVYCNRNNSIERVNELKKEYDDNGYLWSPGLYSVLFGFYTRNAQIQEAAHLYQLLREYHKHFKIDADKLISFARALVKDKQIDQAINVLKSPPHSSSIATTSSSSSSSSTAEEHLSKECWRLLNTIAHSEFAEMTQSILDILVKSGYCQISNTILGPVIRQHLLKNNVEEAVQIFRKFAEHYKCTPLRQELIVALLKLIQMNDSSKERFIKLLDDVKSTTLKIYGANGWNVDIFLGFARTGMRKELQQFIEDHYIPSQLFAQTLKNIADSEKLSTLNEIFHTCTNLPKTHKNSVCEQIFFLHCRSGDCQGAIELWQKMKKADIACSQTFMTELINLLQSHNVPVPEDFPRSSASCTDNLFREVQRVEINK